MNAISVHACMYISNKIAGVFAKDVSVCYLQDSRFGVLGVDMISTVCSFFFSSCFFDSKRFGGELGYQLDRPLRRLAK